MGISAVWWQAAPPEIKPKRPVNEAKEGQTPYEPASQKGVKLNTLLPAQ
jgi:hypothetical protein